MSRNAIRTSGQTPSNSEQKPATEKSDIGARRIQPCPRWCTTHYDVDAGHRDEFRVHKSRVRKASYYAVQLERSDLLSAQQPGRTVVTLDDADLTPMEASALASALAAAVQEAQ